MKELQKRQFKFSGLYLLLAIASLWVLQLFVFSGPKPREVPYSEFLTFLAEGRVGEATLKEAVIVAALVPKAGEPALARPDVVSTGRLPGIDETPLLELMKSKGVVFSGEIQETTWWQQLLLGWFLPFAILGGIYFFAMRRMKKGGGPLSFGKSNAKVYDRSEDLKVTFEDVAGVDEAQRELVEVVDFLKSPARYASLGARIPKGVLLVGPPGTGKTLLARAVAGEASVPFFSMSGSQFVEMFVGVGAARMRDLFEQAKLRAPCIVFIDELDAIGRMRGGLGAMATHDEREQTLNQLLVEMDGFDPGQGVIIMAATNRPEILDRALVRAGRFDRQVLVDRPDLAGRHAILIVHARKVQIAEGVDLRVFAARTPGMVGADLANVVNEAALAAARRNSEVVEHEDFEEAIDRLQLGLKKAGRVMTPNEKRRVAYHESGHALAALSVEHADPVHRVTIIPRSIGALGATLQLPTEERYLMTRDELRDRICVMLAGRAAEEVVFDDVSTGGQNDLERATETARQMVCRFGMSERLGTVTYGRPAGGRFLEMPVSFGEERNFSEETARAIDDEVREIIAEELDRARRLLVRRRAALEAIAGRLLVAETVDRTELEKLAERETGLSSSLRSPVLHRPMHASAAGASSDPPREP